MAGFPQRGSCLCGSVAYELREDPLAFYACHCSDCQRMTGSSFSLSLIARREGVRGIRGEPRTRRVEMPDGRAKESSVCARCGSRLWGPSRVPALLVLEAGTLEAPSWLRSPVHIWTRSAQPWVAIPAEALAFPEQPAPDDWGAIVAAWRGGS